jgi:hypothetical protein
MPNSTPTSEIPAFCYDGEVVKRNVIQHGREFVKHVVPAVIKPARVLWNEIIAFLFFCLAVWFGVGAVRYLRQLMRGEAQSPVAFLLAAFCFAVTFWFAVSSWWRARKIDRA